MGPKQGSTCLDLKASSVKGIVILQFHTMYVQVGNGLFLQNIGSMHLKNALCSKGCLQVV